MSRHGFLVGTSEPKISRSTIRYVKTDRSGLLTSEKRDTSQYIGESEFSYYPRAESNIGSVYLRFWSGKLYTILLTFDDRDFDWRPDEQISQTISRRLRVPGGAWDNEILLCRGFYIRFIRLAGSVQVELTDSETKDEIKTKAERSFDHPEILISAQPKLKPRPVQEGSKKPPRPVLKNRQKLCRKDGESDPIPCA